MQVRVAGDELREGIHDGDHRLSDLLRLHARRSPQRAGSGHSASFERDAAPEWMFHNLLTKKPLPERTGKRFKLLFYRHAFPVRVYLTRRIRTRTMTSTLFITLLIRNR